MLTTGCLAKEKPIAPPPPFLSGPEIWILRNGAPPPLPNAGGLARSMLTILGWAREGVVPMAPQDVAKTL